jgi:hypothetical protein
MSRHWHVRVHYLLLHDIDNLVDNYHGVILIAIDSRGDGHWP